MNVSKLKLIFSLALLAACMFFLNACEKDNENDPAPVPSVSSFSPDSGLKGDTVIISGKNFSAKATENTVKFNATSASVIEATTTKLTVKVPEGATTGKITVSVGSGSATSKNDFTVLQVPVLNSFSPESGLAGDEVTIMGENFSEKAEENTVKFGSIAATVKTATATKLTVIVPGEAATGKITVAVDGRSATSANNFSVINSPAILSFTPSSGMVGDTIHITGEHFGVELTEITVKIGELTAQVIEASATHLRIKVPEGAVTESIYVTVKGQTATTGEATYKVLYKPVIHSFSPKSGPVGTSVTITGEHFSTVLEENVVNIGKASSQTLAKVTAATPTQLTVTVQEGTTTGYVNVAVNGLSATGLEEFFEVIVPPAITGFSPSAGEVGSTLTITGSNFSSTTSENTVKIGDKTVEVTAATKTQLTVTVPEGAETGAISVTVSGATATTGTSEFTVIYAPVITSFAPKRGQIGSTLNVYGEHFSDEKSENIVKIGGVAATVTSAAVNVLSVTIPEGATTGIIEVTVNGKEATPLDLEFMVDTPPTISGFSPSSGKEGEVITITGTNFSEVADDNIVKFSGVQATVTSATATSMEVVIPAGIGAITGKITVKVDDWTVTSTDDFTLVVVDVVKIAAGATHTMFLKEDNTLWATGANNYGQLGDGTISPDFTTKPRLVMENVIDVSAGGSHTLILKSDNTLWACGVNSFGQLGIGTTDAFTTPQQIMGDVKAMVAGSNHSLILTNTDELYACGRNNHGQIGNGETGDAVLSPVLVMSDVKSMAAGNYHTLIVKNNNTLWTTGFNGDGQLGNGKTTDRSTPAQVMSSVKAVSAGAYHSMILKEDNKLWGCGRGGSGQFASGGAWDIVIPELIAQNVLKVEAGQYYTVILTTDNHVYATGSRGYGQLGDGLVTGTNSYYFKDIMGDVTDIISGGYNTFFKKSDNSIWGTGKNDYGQLGIGNLNNVGTAQAIYYYY